MSRQLRALENVKEKIFRSFDSWTDGLGDVESPITTDIAIAQIWQHVQDFALETKDIPKNVLWLRVTVSTHDPTSDDDFFDILAKRKVLSLRRIGPRKVDHDAVYYLTIHARNLTSAESIVRDLETQGFEVRDYTYGC